MLPTLIAAILNCRVSFRVIRPVLFHPTDVAKQSVKRSQEWAWREVEISRRCRQDDRRRAGQRARGWRQKDRKSTRLNSSHTVISYAVFCLKKKKQNKRGRHNQAHKRPRTSSPTNKDARR